MDLLQGLMALFFIGSFGATGDGSAVYSVPPQAYAWEVEIYGAADVQAEFPLSLYATAEGLPQSHYYIGNCGAPVYQVSGHFSRCMVTQRFLARGGVVRFDVDTVYNTAWYLNWRVFKSNALYLPTVTRNAYQPATVSAQQAYP